MPYGVTREILEAYGDVIFRLSLNVQTRRGDPVRKLDREAWARQRDDTGLSDVEIAGRVGLALPQVTFIRNVIERRLFRSDQYRKLFRLGGGKRYRAETYADPAETFAVEPEALLLRQALSFNPKQVTGWLDGGFWSAETTINRLDELAGEDPEAVFLVDAAGHSTRRETADRAYGAAASLAALGLRRGDVVALMPLDGRTWFLCLLGIAALGGAALLLPQDCIADQYLDLMRRARARALVAPPADVSGDPRGGAPSLDHIVDPDGLLAHELPNSPLAGPVAADPLTLTPTQVADSWALVPHSHQTVLANARATTAAGCNAAGLPLEIRLWQALAAGAAVDLTAPIQGTAVLFSAETQVLGYPANGAFRATSGTELQAVDGTIVSRGPGLFPGYFDNLHANGFAFTDDGWFRTPWRGHVDDEMLVLEN
ncbi:MAG: AMP-binding protein [Alphaproteobacteria bacterium]|nr:AMP-binding protein [Alphaproteobacteria bacterium]